MPATPKLISKVSFQMSVTAPSRHVKNLYCANTQKLAKNPLLGGYRDSARLLGESS